MVLVELDTNTLAILIAGLYCTDHQVDVQAVSRSVWLSIAEQLSFFIPEWDFNKISFEDWIANSLFIYPTVMLDENTVKEMQSNGIYYELPNGNVMLSISMDVSDINDGGG